MLKYSNDLNYAYIQLGLDPGVSLEEIQKVLVNAAAYRFFTKTRLEHIEKFVDFFLARSQLGSLDSSFSEIKKSYHKKAMDLHPDRNRGSNATEEELKKANTAYALIEKINQESKDYYKQSDDVRHAIEKQARQATEREKPEKKSDPIESHISRHASPESTRERSNAPPKTSSQKKYIAAPIPRSMRTARLGYLPLHSIIGSRITKKGSDINFIFDIIMLPADQFVRAKSYLAVPEMVSAQLQYGKFSPSYVPKDAKEVTVPADTADPEKFARDYFIKEFGLLKT